MLVWLFLMLFFMFVFSFDSMFFMFLWFWSYFWFFVFMSLVMCVGLNVEKCDGLMLIIVVEFIVLWLWLEMLWDVCKLL